MKFQKITFLFIGLLIFLTAALVIPFYIPGEPDAITQDVCGKHNKNAGPVDQNTMIIQEFTMQKTFLKGIEIELATWARNNTNNNILTILDKDYQIISQQNFASNIITDNALHRFRFRRPLSIGAGKPFYICITSPDGTAQNSITAWIDSNCTKGRLFISNGDFREIKTRVENRKTPIKGSLILRTLETDRDAYISKLIATTGILLLFVLIGFLAFKRLSEYGKHNKQDQVLVLCFLITISIPGLYFYTLEYKPPQNNNREKRTLSHKPDFRFDSIADFPVKYEKHFNDYFPGREFIIRLRSRLYYDIFHKSIFPDKIVLGKEKWLFKPGERKVVEGNTEKTASRLNEIAAIMHKRSALYKAKGIDLYIVLVPMKSDINRAWLPDYYSLSKSNIFPDEISAALKRDTSLNVIDTKQALQRSNFQGDVFYKTDFHWSEKGAFIAYQEIMKNICVDYPGLKILKNDDFLLRPSNVVSGNDAIELGLDGYLREDYFYFDFKNPESKEVPKVGYPPPAGFGLTDYYEIVYENKNKDLPKVLVIRDSFFHLLVPMISESFSRSVFIWDKWQYGPNLMIIEKEKPDIVILEMYASFLNDIKDIKE